MGATAVAPGLVPVVSQVSAPGPQVPEQTAPLRAPEHTVVATPGVQQVSVQPQACRQQPVQVCEAAARIVEQLVSQMGMLSQSLEALEARLERTESTTAEVARLVSER